MSIALALIFAAPPASAVASPGRPALVAPRIDRGAFCSRNPQLVVAVTGFTPPRTGHVDLRVSLRTDDGRRRALGTAGIFPEQAFSASLDEAQKFGFALPKAALARHPRVIVEIAGAGTGARAVIAEARIGPAPGDRC